MPPIIVATPKEISERWPRDQVHQFAPVPLYDDAARVAAGPPSAADADYIEGYAIIWRDWVHRPEDCTAVRVKGDSMSPELKDGSIVCLEHRAVWPNLPVNRIVVAQVENEGVTVKYLRRQGKKYFLRPVNTKYNCLEFNRSRGDVIIGVVVWSWSPAP